MEKGAYISKCGTYRYKLWRIWDDSLPKALFVMLNPSTADGNQDDPTIRRCINFAKSWGYGGIYVGNLFAYRATNPKELLGVKDPVGEYNTGCLLKMEMDREIAVCAWGNSDIVSKLKGKYNPSIANIDLCYLELSKDGTPKHPLYLRSILTPKRFT